MSRLNGSNPGGSPKGTYGRGPTRGNESLGSKMKDLMDEKDSLKGLARQLTEETAGKAADLGTKPNAGGKHANISSKRGPTKGNG